MWIIVYYSHSYNSSIHILLTDKVIRNAKTKTSKYNLKDTSGLFVRVNPQGSKIFFFRYKWLEKDTLLNIGEYGKWSLTKAREKRDQLIDDLAVGINPKEESTKGATFTISSLSGIGGKYFTPIINPPEVGILGLSKTYDSLSMIDENIITLKQLPISLSYDHRVINGAYAAKFIVELGNQLKQIDLFIRTFKES